MLNKRQLEIYRQELINENQIGLHSIKLLETVNVQNKRFSSGLIPKPTKSISGATWSDQWMALSGSFSGRCRCASCGKLIFEDTSDPDCIKLAKAYNDKNIIPGCTPESLKIQGGHIVLKRDIVDGKYLLAHKGATCIVPLCKECNNFNVLNLDLMTGSIITPEIR